MCRQFSQHCTECLARTLRLESLAPDQKSWLNTSRSFLRKIEVSLVFFSQLKPFQSAVFYSTGTEKRYTEKKLTLDNLNFCVTRSTQVPRRFHAPRKIFQVPSLKFHSKRWGKRRSKGENRFFFKNEIPMEILFNKLL